MGIIKAALFDLDDTLFDYTHSRISAFAAIKTHFDILSKISVDDIDSVWTRSWYELMPQEPVKTFEEVMKLRSKRINMVFQSFGGTPSKNEIEEASQIFTDVYNSTMRPVPGALDLLKELKKRGIFVCVLTNNPPDGQKRKLEICGLDRFVDSLVASGEVGIAKPDPRIFSFAMHKSRSEAENTVMIGDTWDQDIIGAVKSGMRAVWLNRFSTKIPENGSYVRELRSYVPLETALKIIIE